MAEQPRSIPAIAYRTLWERLAELRGRDPDSRELRRLARKLARIGRRAGAVQATYGKDGENLETRHNSAALDPNFAWDRTEIALSPNEAEVVGRVAKITVIPE